ncbi:hypothetical protein CYMTET_17234 [Cymbomonas tetramitiformis]|uniref:EGF-like domain-containing protein n=1 Tax=Cymbomonas tetramitiformis TaxID=36881 RepID=A0AAE0GAH9_9CHLO|nr:hypothetical protein CYMTET_17234 [Cymbomonas tetramitiformis]
MNPATSQPTSGPTSGPTFTPPPPPNPPPPSPPPPTIELTEGAAALYWTGFPNTTCVTFSGLTNISSLTVISSSVPNGTSALAYSLSGAAICSEDNWTCSFDLCGFSLGTTTLDGTIVFTAESGTPTSHLMSTVSSTISFSALSLTSFSSSSFNTSFRADFASQMAEAAGVSSDLVSISSISAGSVQVDSIVYITDSFPSASAAVFEAVISNSVGTVFTYSSFSSYGAISVSSVITGSAGPSVLYPVVVAAFPPQSPNAACATDPCFPGVPCTDLHNASQAYTCGPCPAGYIDGNPTSRGTECTDVDECADSALVNGGCDPLTVCTNFLGGRECSTCPDGYAGDGASGCSLAIMCSDNNGGCDVLTTCTEMADGTTECSACPTGYEGTGPTACTDLDRCAALPCFPGVACTDEPAPGLGYACGACPSGYDGDGVTCSDVDECAGLVHGGCDVLAECVNTLGGRTCGPCPSGYWGSGYAQCTLASPCHVDNGGCDRLVTCLDTTTGVPECGPCPEGYTGTGTTGCLDEDGCAAAGAEGGGCYPGVACADTPAPASGYTCGTCPVGMDGDGTTCWENLCFSTNGGCSPRATCTNDPSHPAGRVCGACPEGYSDEHADGTSCVDTDGCATSLCFPGVACTDVAAPGTGFACGECPGGYSGDGATCNDVDECARGDNGGCDAVTQCVNVLGGRECGECPEGFMGTGEVGCRRTQTCDVDNGGCHELTTCTEVWDRVECGDCPSGYEGSGETTCTDIDGCAPSPCFPRVMCTDVPAPGDGHACAACPEGYKGDGEACEKCILEMGIVSSTVVSGKVKSAFRNQVIANLAGLSDRECVPATETSFYWAGSASDGSLLTLNDELNKAGTLRLNFPKSTLTTHLAYTVTLAAHITASPEVKAEDGITFYVEPQALIALVTPSELQTGQDSHVFLDASASYDPDNEAADMSFTWRCVRADATGHCRDRDGMLLPSTWTASTISLSLEGSAEGLAYTFTLQVRKGAREAEVTATVTMTSGPLPVPAIVALPNKVNANEKVVLTSTVNSSDPTTLSLLWTAKPEAGTAALDLASVAATALTLANLVLRPDELQAGGAYTFQLSVEDSNGPAATSLRVVVNEPPSQGGLTVEPTEGTVLDTMFQMAAFGWVDEDTPLWYQMGYVVTGTSSSEMLNEFQPMANAKSMLPQEGLEAYAQEVTVYVHVRDALGALASSSASVAVWPAAVAIDAQFVDDQLAVSETAAANGDVDTSVLIVDALAMALNKNAKERRRRRRRGLLQSADAAAEQAPIEAEQAADRTRQRQSMMVVVEGARDNLQATDSSLERLTMSTQKVVDDPEEVDPTLQRTGFSMMEGVVSEAASPDSDAGITAGTTAAVGGALSSLVLAGVLNPSGEAGAPNPAAQGLSTLGAMGNVLTAGMVDGEEAATVDAPVLSMAVRQESLSDPNSKVFGSPLVTPSGSGVSFPRSIGGVAGGGSTAIQLLTSTVDPHINVSSNATNALRRLLIEQEELLESEAPNSVSSAVTSISLIDASGHEIEIRDLEEGISFTLPLEDPNSANGSAAPPQCMFWDTSIGRYDGAGCAALPNPRPRGVELIWRTLNASEVGGELHRMWTIDSSSWFLEACSESFDALYPEYLGMDEGMRKYIGEGCVAADMDNTASCWWQWDAEAFFGQGCEWDTELHCLCTHLTDFKAMQDQEVGTLAPPKVSTVGADDMGSLSPSDVLQSLTLLAVLAGLMLGCVLLSWLSDWGHKEGKLAVFRQLMSHQGTDVLWFRKFEDLWTWSLLAEQVYSPSVVLNGQLKNALSIAVDVSSTQPTKFSKRKARLNALDDSRGDSGPESTILPSEQDPAVPQSGTGSISQVPTATDLNDVTLEVFDVRHPPVYYPPVYQSTVSLEAVSEATASRKPVTEAAGYSSSLRALREELQERPTLDEQRSAGPRSMATGGGGIHRSRIYSGTEDSGNSLRRSQSTAVPSSASVVKQSKRPRAATMIEGPVEAVLRTLPPLKQSEPQQDPQTDMLLQVANRIVGGASGTSGTCAEHLHQESKRLHRMPSGHLAHKDPKRERTTSGHLGHKDPKRERTTSHLALSSNLAHQDAKRERAHSGHSVPRLEQTLALALGSSLRAGNKGALSLSPDSLSSQLALKRDSSIVRGGERRYLRQQSLETLIEPHLLARGDLYPEPHSGGPPPQYRENTQKQRLALSSGGAAKSEARRRTMRRALVLKAIQATRRSDLMSSEKLCDCVGFNFTALILSLPIEVLRRQAAAAVHAKCGLYKTRRGLAGTGEAPGARPEDDPVHDAARHLSVHHLLSLERMLGTAAVHAFLRLNSCLLEEVTLKHVAPAQDLPWECPPGKDFQWFCRMFEVMVQYGKRPGWYIRSRLYRLVTCQEPDGHFELSQDLVNALWAGHPDTPPEDSVVGNFDMETVLKAMPESLHGDPKLPQPKAEAWEAEAVWATVLAVALHEQLPCKWTVNPNAPPAERSPVTAASNRWLEADERPDWLRDLLPELRETAARLVDAWQQAHINRLIAIQTRMAVWWASVSEPQPSMWKVCYTWVATSAFWIVSSHPLVAIYLVKPTEPFSRAERLVVQVNVFIVMLSFCMFFYLSKAIECCADFKEYVGCPFAGSRTAECLGEATCEVLFKARTDGFLPIELGEEGFICTAFPSATWTDRIWSVIFINAALIPVNVLLMALFSISGAAAAPGHLTMDGGKLVSQLMGPQRGALMTNTFLFLYALFFDIKMLTKTITMLFMAGFAMIFKPVKLVTKHVKWVLAVLLPVYMMLSAVYHNTCRYFWAKMMQEPFVKFGIKALKLMTIRSFGRYVAKKYDQLIVGTTIFNVLDWYEGYILDASPLAFEVPDADGFFGGADLAL